MARNLETDLETLRKVLSLAQNRDFVRAAALAEQTLASGFEHPMLLNIAATRLEQQGKYEQALPLLERAVAIAPKDVGARNALGLCLQRLDRPADALVHIDELLKQHADLPFAHASKGNALIALGSLGRARQSHLRALELDPANFTSLAALASIATHRGQHEEARGWAERALTVAPGLPDAVLSLAAADLAAGDLESAEKRLRGLIMDSRAGPTDRARATGLLADVLDAGGRYGEAFEAYEACNQALRQIHRRFAGSNVLGYTRALTAAIEKIDAGQWHIPPEAEVPEAAGHVFLLGFPRSGTTLLEVVLDGNPRIVSLEEHELLADGVLAFMREPVNLQPLARAEQAAVNDLRQAYWRGVRAAGADVAGKVFVDKHPLNSMKLPLIAKLFPQAKILFAVRDPRDVILSCFRRRFKMNPSMYELLTLPGAAAFYAAVMGFADTAKHSLHLNWREVRYESLVADLEGEMRGVCEFIGLEWLAAMGEFADRAQAREHATPSTAQLSQGLVTSATAQWRNYERQILPALPVLEPWMNRFRYF
jgi:tetratricopeptide (TPR) repeat protein